MRGGTPNQLASEVGVVSYTYDPLGNRATAGTKSFVYDPFDQLTSVQVNGNTAYQAEYDAFGRRAQTTVAGLTVLYLHNDIGELMAEVNASTGALITRYVWGPQGVLYRVNGASRRYYLHDGMGHVRLLVTKVGQTTDRYTYDAWGNIISQSGTTPNPFRWNGEYGYIYVPATGLYHVGAREYDPGAGRWLQRDPLGAAASPNVYSYASNSPTALVDPEGDFLPILAAIWVVADAVLDAVQVAEDVTTAVEHLRDGKFSIGDAGNLLLDAVCLAVPGANSKLIHLGAEVVTRTKGLLGKVCFPAGTQVLTPTGPLPIEQLQPGMLVVARSDTGPLVNVPVTSARTHVADETLLFSFVGGASLQTTAEHPVYVGGIGYQPARQLAVGTVVRTATGQATVQSLSTLSGPTQVYDLSVESPHNFFAGSAQAQVHNKWIVDWVKSAVKNRTSKVLKECTGDNHHEISKRIAKALNKHETLKGKFNRNDPRFKTQARDKAAHNGYEKWHREYDEEVVKWLEKNKYATEEQFIEKLREIYGRPDMRDRFPNFEVPRPQGRRR